MEMKLHLDGEDPKILRIPTLWDAIENQWIGFIQTPKTKKILSGKGKTSFDLQNDFNINMSSIFNDPLYFEEVYSMFKPESEWK